MNDDTYSCVAIFCFSSSKKEADAIDISTYGSRNDKDNVTEVFLKDVKIILNTICFEAFTKIVARSFDSQSDSLTIKVLFN